MQPAPGKPGPALAADIIPPCPKLTRDIIPGVIRTTQYMAAGAGWYLATFTEERVFAHPHDGHVFFRWRPERRNDNTKGERGACTGRWIGSVVVECFENTELAALADLLAQLDHLEIAYDPRARAILEAMAITNNRTPWELRPMGLRPGKPRALRHWWTINGKRTAIYRDTLKPHRDPSCQCTGCQSIAMQQHPTPTKKTEKKT